MSSLTPGQSGTFVSDENRVINGQFIVDQVNEFAAVTPAATGYVADMWQGVMGQASKYSCQIVSDGPSGASSKSLLVTVVSTYTALGAERFNIKHRIEGTQIFDLGFGTAGGQPIMVSFWMKSSLTGAFPVSLSNAANNRTYLTTVTINAANTWEYKTIALTADVTGTWLTTATSALQLNFDLGSGPSTASATVNAWQAANANIPNSGSPVALITNAAATLNIAEVRLRRGSSDVTFVPRPFAEELSLCQRYFCKTFNQGTAPAQNAGVVGAITVRNPIALGDPSEWWQFPVTMRTTPTITTYNPSAANANWRDLTAGADVTVDVTVGAATLGSDGVLIATSGTVTTLGDVLAIHATASATL